MGIKITGVEKAEDHEVPERYIAFEKWLNDKLVEIKEAADRAQAAIVVATGVAFYNDAKEVIAQPCALVRCQERASSRQAMLLTAATLNLREASAVVCRSVEDKVKELGMPAAEAN